MLGKASVWFVLAIAFCPAQAAELAAKVVVARGEVLAQIPGAAARVLAVGSEVHARDKVTTGPESGIRLHFTDGTSLQLGSHSEMSINQYDARRERPAFLAEIAKGVFRMVTGLIAKGQPHAVRVIIPVASIGIRGTNFGGEVTPSSALIVLLEPEDGDQGMVIDVSNSFGSVTIDKPGYGTEIPDAVSPPSPPRRMRLRAIDNLIRSLSTIQRMQVPRGPTR